MVIKGRYLLSTSVLLLIPLKVYAAPYAARGGTGRGFGHGGFIFGVSLLSLAGYSSLLPGSELRCVITVTSLH